MAFLIHKKTNQILAKEILYSHSFFKRIRGLLGFKKINSQQVMWIKPCTGIHTFFMKFPIDVLFADQNLCVKSVCKNVSPWKIINSTGKTFSFLQYYMRSDLYHFKNYFQNTSVFEFQAGVLARHSLQQGDQLHVDS